MSQEYFVKFKLKLNGHQQPDLSTLALCVASALQMIDDEKPDCWTFDIDSVTVYGDLEHVLEGNKEKL
jgi:hypothetical protein